jgi:hypothetical protein
MVIWSLIIWSAYISAFEAGQYRTFRECDAIGSVQSLGLRNIVGPGKLYWTCKQQGRFIPQYFPPPPASQSQFADAETD